MTAAHSCAHTGPWTARDLFDLPDDGNRHELVDGALIMSSPPGPRHQLCSFRVAQLLDSAARETAVPVRTIQAVGVRMRRDLLIPDVVVARADGSSFDEPFLDTRDVLLAVEIVAPDSGTRERTEKPYLYAEAGIPHFWRVETGHFRGRTQPLPVVLAYALVESEYRQVTSAGAGETFQVAAPFPISFDVAAIMD